jgi:hypothetical protein
MLNRIMAEIIRPKDQIEEKISIDFFGRPIVTKPKSETDRPLRNAKMEGKLKCAYNKIMMKMSKIS